MNKHCRSTNVLKVLHQRKGFISAINLVLIFLSCTFTIVSAQPLIELVVYDPFGYIGYSPFQPRYTYDNNGQLIENTDYGIKNLDLGSVTTCFQQPWNNIWHAGEDLYWVNRAYSTQGVAVYSIAPGYVRYAPRNINYPGSVIIIEHYSSVYGSYYSVYAHLIPESVSVNVGDPVDRHTFLGQILYQAYTGVYPEYHQSPAVADDSHLHFEIRNFYDGSNIYSSYPGCNLNGNVAGKGYTYPQLLGQFPSSTIHYFHPSEFISANQYKSHIPRLMTQ